VIPIQITHVGFSDESNWNVGRFRSLGLITTPLCYLEEIELTRGEFVVMPNHVHGIVWIVKRENIGAINTGMSDAVGVTGRSPLSNHPCGPIPRSLALFMGGFKSAVTKRVNECRGTPGAPLRQCGYYEHIIRSDESLNHIGGYFWNNPFQWAMDRAKPDIMGAQPVVVPRPGDEPWHI